MNKIVRGIIVLLIFSGIYLVSYYIKDATTDKITMPGVIYNVSSEYKTFLLVNSNPKSGEMDQIYLRAAKFAKVYNKNNKKVDFSYLKNGMRVQVTIEGAIMESYPPQGVVSVIRIIE